jgi:hypothetical protein
VGNHHQPWLKRAERVLFGLLFLAAMALVAGLSQRYTTAFDWTDSGRNTLSAASTAVLERMPGRIHVRAFVSGNDTLREAVRQLVHRYRRGHSDVHLEFIDPQREPRLAQQFQVRQDGELVVEYADATQNVKGLSERAMSNALARLARQGSSWATWLESPGARRFDGKDRRDLGAFSQHLATLGVRLHPLSPGSISTLPDNVGLLVVPQPREPWPRAVADAVRAYLDRGGNLLWLADPGGASPAALAGVLGVTPEPGLLVDPSSRLDGRSTPEFIVVDGYASHPVTAELAPHVVFPTVASLAWEAQPGWTVRGIAASGLRSWRETGNLEQAVRFDEDVDVPGPLDIAVALQRPRSAGPGMQRVLVFGDSDFLSNAYLGLGANRTLGSNAMNWLGDAEHLVNVPTIQAPDLDYAPSQTARAIIALGAPVLLPACLFGFGVLRWRRRRRG